MCKQFVGRRVPPCPCRHQGEHRAPRVTRHAAAARRAAPDARPRPSRRPPGAPLPVRGRPTSRCDGADGPDRRVVANEPPQTLSEPPRRGRRDCMWSLNRIGRVSPSVSRPSGAVQPSRAGAAARSGRTGRGACEDAAPPGARCVPPRRAVRSLRPHPRERDDGPPAARAGSGADDGRSPEPRHPPGRGDAPRRRTARSRRRCGAPPRREGLCTMVSSRPWQAGRGVSVTGPGAPAGRVTGHRHLLGRRATLGHRGRYREVALREAKSGQIGPRRLLDATQDHADPHLAGTVGIVPPAQQLARPPGTA